IFLAKVDSIDPDKPAAVLVFEENFKGKVAFRRMAINLKGDADAEKGKQTPQLLKRLAPKLPLVVFAVEQDKGYLALCYTNGTWFQIRGDKDGDAVRWRFNHFEPYLRRTFKGTTEEMKQSVADGLSDKKPFPAAKPKEKPGIGPEVSQETETSGQGDKETWRQGDKETIRFGARRASITSSPCLVWSPCLLVSSSPCLVWSPCLNWIEPSFAVIPSVLVGGPLAVLAMLFPTLFGGWKRWLALISVACTISTLYFVQWLFAESFAGSWWETPGALWLGMMLTILLGLSWAWSRQLRRVENGESQAAPSRTEFVLLAILSVLGVGILAFYRLSGGSLLDPRWLPVGI